MPHQTAIDPLGYFYALPALGLPDPAGDWVRVRMAFGSKQDCARLANECKVADAPLRIHNSLYGIMEVEMDDAIWFLPISVSELRSKSSSAAAEVFSVKVQRMPAASSPPANRPKVPEGTDWLYLNMRAGTLSFGQFPRDDSSILAKLNSPYAKEALDLFRMCQDPAPSQCQPPGPTATTRKAREAAEREKKRREDIAAVAWNLWNALVEHSVGQDWLNGLCVGGGKEMAFAIRVCPENDGDVRGLDYSLDEHMVDWKPVPDHAANPKWARAGVNIQRWAFGKQLFSKDDWPNRRPTTSMMRKGGTK